MDGGLWIVVHSVPILLETFLLALCLVFVILRRQYIFSLCLFQYIPILLSFAWNLVIYDFEGSPVHLLDKMTNIDSRIDTVT